MLFKSLSIQSKLMLMLLAVAIVSIGTISWIAYSNGKDALTSCVNHELTSVRASKKIQIEAFFKNIRNEVSNLADDRMIVDFMREASAGYSKLKTAQISPEWDQSLLAYYRDDYLPKLAQTTGQTPRLEAFLPRRPEARYLQHWYIANNKNPPAERYKLKDAGDGSEYSAVHARYHPILSKLILDFALDNVALVEQNTGAVVYTFGKSQLFGTNLLEGPYSDSTAGELFRSLRKSQNSNEVQVVDFAPAAYSTGKPVALMGAPILDGPNQIGVLFLQFPIDEINRVMTDNFGWVEDGLGKTGETYLVGPDMLMRSRSRRLHEDPPRYYRELEKAGYSPEEIGSVRRAGTATLAQVVRSKNVENALAGRSGLTLGNNYRGIPSLTSYAPLNIPGLHWVIIAQMEADEAFAPLSGLERAILISSIAMILAVTVAAAFLGRRFVRPIFHLVEGARRLKAGQKDVAVNIESKDEFADLGMFFNEISSSITSMTELAAQRTQERDDLISNILPMAAASRMKHGQDQVSDEYSEVSILYASLSSAEPGGPASGQKSLSFLTDLVIALDDAAERRGVEKLSGNGVTYIAVCGMSRQRLDHATRILDFAQDILKTAHRLNRDRQTNLRVQIGIGSGPAIGGVVGRTRLSYYLLGETMTVSRALARQAPPDGILVNRQIYASAENLYSFGAPVQVTSPGGEAITAWPLASELGGHPGAQSSSDPGPGDAGAVPSPASLMN